MKKIKKIIKEHDNLSMFIFLIILTSTMAFYRYLDANDELWNFSNIYKMCNGYTIYKDLNVIITPLYFLIGKIWFSMFGANYFVFRIYQTMVPYLFLLFTTYQIFKKLNIRKLDSWIYTTIIGTTSSLFFADANYNILVIAFVALGIYNLISSKMNLKQATIQAIITFLVFLTKQNVGIYYLLALLIIELIENIEIKEKVKIILIQIAELTLLMLSFFVIMNINGIWYDFINYAFLGIKEFGNNNVKYQLVYIIITIAEILINILIIAITYNIKISFTSIQKNNIRKLGIIALAMIGISYPIFNFAHIIIASITYMIFLFYTLDVIIFSEFLNTEYIIKLKKCVLFVVIFFICIISLILNIGYWYKLKTQKYYFKRNSPYYGTLVKEETIEEINDIISYIKEENEKETDVKIISYYSNLYMNLLNRNNGDMDLPFYGNMGQGGEDEMIEKIKKLKNTKILILTEDDDFYQESKKITKYIKENFNKEGEIGQFSIYTVE